jgi:SNF2 family DNA or RNA helicase
MLQLAEWATRSLLGDAGVRGMYFSGQESARRRVANLVRFHDLPDARVLWATDAGAVGLNLQRAASCCINLELPWNPAVLEQRIGRIYRLGQREPVDVYNLVGIGGIEERIERLLGDKRMLFAELFDGSADSITFGQSPSQLAWILAVATPSLTRGGGNRAEAA